ncbi:F-box domain-containing protein [Orpheovirus IHUMI-LCC2]|uniref:F-box domain-containing protein n=1 Tax=Orpheovirus IHUMI-LCC2 TaxID=2023057 RepID=A0A2I2L3U1_9VIRU|nr:F-box domain-containing protein [Orpheovirus IHUMI-LCC2]SNW62129.1 F-box domain-containing protein [Orpheovirus IHUMI-LCC2]
MNNNIDYIALLPNEILIDYILPYVDAKYLANLCSCNVQLSLLHKDQRLWLNRLNIEYPYRVNTIMMDNLYNLYMTIINDDNIPVYRDGDIIGHIQLKNDKGFSSIINRLQINNMYIVLLGENYNIYYKYFIRNMRLEEITDKNNNKLKCVNKILVTDKECRSTSIGVIKNNIFSNKSKIPIYGEHYSSFDVMIYLYAGNLTEDDYCPMQSRDSISFLTFGTLSPSTTYIIINYILNKLGSYDRLEYINNEGVNYDASWNEQHDITEFYIYNNNKLNKDCTMKLLISLLDSIGHMF